MEATTVPHDLNTADEKILEALKEGRATPVFLADELGYRRQYVHQRLQLLKAAELVENLGHGLYERVDLPTLEPDGGGEIPEGSDDYPMECVCGRIMIDVEDAHGHILNCDELGS